jgi:two-component sensor histidine kinase
MLAVATLIRFIFGYLGATLYFTTYFPAILVIAVFAGSYAAAVSILLTAFLVWWAFITPHYTFNPIGALELVNFGMFFFSSGLIVWLAHLYRLTQKKVASHERSRDILVKELEHRGRNTFAVVEAIVRQTLKDHPMQAEVIVGRVRAVSSTNDIINASQTHSVSLRRLLEKELEAHGHDRITLSGPEIELGADSARNVSLVFHELTTNAVKYGALKDPRGRINIDWRFDETAIVLIWDETDGPPVIAPTHLGFGSRLLQHSMRALGGTIEPLFKPEGLSCRIVFHPDLEKAPAGIAS